MSNKLNQSYRKFHRWLCVVSVAGSSLIAREAAAYDIMLSGAVIPHINSPYRNSASSLGYDTKRGDRLGYEGELSFAWTIPSVPQLSFAPLARFHGASLTAPYDGLSSIGTYNWMLGGRAEFEFLSYPRLALWADGSFGLAMFAMTKESKWTSVVGVRGGLALRVGPEQWHLRFRLGIAYTPTLTAVTSAAGSFNFGGAIFAIDGVFHASH